MDPVARLSGYDLAALRARGPSALPGVLRDEFRLYLAGRNFASSTQLTYYKRARGYLKWLVSTESHPEALSDGPLRDAAVADYLAREQRASTRKVTLAAIRALYEWFDLGPVMVDVERVVPVAPPTLSADEQSRVLDAAAARSARDYALVTLMLDVGPSASEVCGLDDDAVNLSARAGAVTLTGVDGLQRTLVLTQATTWVLMGYRRERRALLERKSRVRAFFLTLSSHSRIGNTESLGYILAGIGDAAGLGWKLTASALRATAELRLYRSGLSPAEVRARMGQSSHNGPRVRALLGEPSPPSGKALCRSSASASQLSFDLGL